MSCHAVRSEHGSSARFAPEALKRAEDCLREYALKIAQFGPDVVKAVATSAAREANNKEDFIAIGAKYGIPIEIISGTEEAKLSFFGGTSDFIQMGNCRVIDVGGGSTEFILGSKGGIQASRSLDLGCVRLTERFISGHPVFGQELRTLRTFVQSQLDHLPHDICTGSGPVIAVSGTPTTLASVILGEKEFNAKSIHGFKLKLAIMEEWCERIMAMTLTEISSLPGMEPQRADVILAGLLILIESSKILDVEELIVSARGVRYGAALEVAK
ncbi:MAG: Ppx/GppA family phosphatase [Bdellovibrionales bacterium]|nr:Ppx/GppA family phosphatase [Bdellovibrionales bacterium]